VIYEPVFAVVMDAGHVAKLATPSWEAVDRLGVLTGRRLR
jgi:hypothetical protein